MTLKLSNNEMHKVLENNGTKINIRFMQSIKLIFNLVSTIDQRTSKESRTKWYCNDIQLLYKNTYNKH